MTPTDLRPPAVLRHHGGVVGMLAAVAVAVAVAVELAPILAVPAHVAKLRIGNPTVYQLNVEVTDAREGGWLDLGTIGRERNRVLEEVTDQGRRWVFRFSYGGVDAGRLDVERSDLAKAGWSLDIPIEVGDRLRAAGLAPSAL